MTEQFDDRAAIVDLTAAYCWALDTRDYERLRAVFLPNATARLGSVAQTGIDEIIERVGTSLSRFDASQHMVSTHEIEITGDEATCRCYLHAQHVRPAGEEPGLFTVGGCYEDRLVRMRDGWRIAHRSLTTMWRAGE